MQAHTHDNDYFSLLKNIEHTKKVDSILKFESNSSFKVDSSEKELKKDYSRTIVDEGDDSESNTFKKKLTGSHYFTSVFSTPVSADFFNNFKNRLPIGKHFLYFSSQRWFILFQVFRI